MSATAFVPTPADLRIREIVAAYPGRVPRADLSAVDALRAAAGIEFADQTVVVVGTNGKTSTAIFMERLLRAAGIRTGLTTSPHIRAWGERVTVGGESIPDERLLAELERLHALAADRGSLRFFDLVTLAAAAVFANEQVEVAIYEAGIGGRLDTTRAVGAPLVVLTGIGLDHEELLGHTELEVLREKLGVARKGATVVSAELPDELLREANVIAEREDLELVFAERAAGSFLERNAALAVHALRNAPFEVGAIPDHVGTEGLPGRMQRLQVDGVDVILDAAHNPQGWEELGALLPPRYVALVSISRDRSPGALAAALTQARHVVVTEAWSGRSYDATELATILAVAGLEVEAVGQPAEAVDAALRFAKAERLPLVVFGSAYLLPHALAAFGR